MPAVLRFTIPLMLLASIVLAADQHAPAILNRAKGPIAKIDLPANLITITTKAGSNTFVLTPKTYIFREKEKITAAQLKVGEIIAMSLYLDEQGRLLINRIKAYSLETTSTTNAPPATPK